MRELLPKKSGLAARGPNTWQTRLAQDMARIARAVERNNKEGQNANFVVGARLRGK